MDSRSLLRGFILVLLSVMLLTGLLLLFVYRVDSAHTSTLQIRAHPVWRIVQALHHWGSAVLILSAGVYLLLLLFSGQFRRPTHWGWYAILALIAFVMLAQLTGHALPWDQRAYSTVIIETEIAGDMPFIGSMLVRLMRVGDTVTQATLALWYRLHVLVAPLLLMGWLYGVSRLGWWQELRTKGAWRDPRLWGLTGIWVIVSVLLSVPFGAAADPNASYEARPEWYVLPLHACLHLLQETDVSLRWIGSGLLPGLLTALLFALPFLVKSRSNEARSPWIVLGSMLGLLLVAVVALSAVGNVASPFSEPAAVHVQTTASPDLKLDAQKITKGAAIFRKRRCMRCHFIGTEGNRKGRNLTTIGKKRPDLRWHVEHLRAPKKVVPGSTMPAYQYLTPEEQDALAQYLVSLR